MKLMNLVAAGVFVMAAGSAFAADSAEQIPAPTIEMRAAGAVPTPIPVVTSSAIPSPTIELVPQASASSTTSTYQNYNSDARGSTQWSDSESGSAPSITTMVR
jgi:hypothetical protein